MNEWVKQKKKFSFLTAKWKSYQTQNTQSDMSKRKKKLKTTNQSTKKIEKTYG